MKFAKLAALGANVNEMKEEIFFYKWEKTSLTSF